MVSVIKLDDFREVPLSLSGSYLAVGNFDGVHLGHRNLISRLRALADEHKAPSLILTFDPHPVVLLRPEQAPAPLLWIDRKVDLLKDAGASEVIVFQTGRWLLNLTAREFFERVILDQFHAKGMVEGPNFAFGRDRGGDSSLLAEWCRQSSLDIDVVEPKIEGGELVSSSRIRALLDAGDVAEASRLLDRPYRLRGIVTHGAARGRGLGFPTANLDDIDTLIPADGVYAALAYIDGKGPARATATHIGPNVSFGEQIRKVESHLIDFDGDLYGKTVELEFLQRIRGSRRFEGIDDLLAQIRKDVEQARAIGGG